MAVVNNIIEAYSVYKTYRPSSDFKIEDLNLEFKEGRITGLVGKNGSGKTTILKLLAGLLHPDKGSIEILGYNINQQFNEVREHMGFMYSEHHFYEYLSGGEFLYFIGKIKGVGLKALNDRIQNYSAYFEMDKILDKTIIKYSNGTKQKLSFLSQIINHPRILMLDEPLNGLDPVMAKKMILLIRELAVKYKTCIVVSAHQLSFIQEICDSIIVINDGQVVFNEEIAKCDTVKFQEHILKMLDEDALSCPVME